MAVRISGINSLLLQGRRPVFFPYFQIHLLISFSFGEAPEAVAPHAKNKSLRTLIKGFLAMLKEEEDFSEGNDLGYNYSQVNGSLGRAYSRFIGFDGDLDIRRVELEQDIGTLTDDGDIKVFVEDYLDCCTQQLAFRMNYLREVAMQLPSLPQVPRPLVAVNTTSEIQEFISQREAWHGIERHTLMSHFNHI